MHVCMCVCTHVCASVHVMCVHVCMYTCVCICACDVCACVSPACSVPRGVGCIFYEMSIGKPMFPGSSVEEELELIWKV